MVKDIKFSIILPVYNVEGYLEKCLQSIINQTYKNFEIICVDDGSSDNSAKILDEYKNKDKRIKVISQKNQGQGAARNAGMDIAQGDYVSFIDPDDYIDKNMYEILSQELNKNNFDVLQFNYDCVVENEIKESNYFNICRKKFGLDLEKKSSYSYKDFRQGNFLVFKSACWNKVYSLKFLRENSIKFPPHKFNEDSLFAISILLHTEYIPFVNKNLYHYCMHSGSTIRSLKGKNMFFVYEQIDYIKNLLEKKNMLNNMKKEFEGYCFELIYDGYKKSKKEFLKEYNQKAKDYLGRKYILFIFKVYLSKISKYIFSASKDKCSKNKKYKVVFFGRQFDVTF